jgi:cytochrome P450
MQTAAWALRPFPWLTREWRRHGDAFRVRIARERWVVLADPEAVREVFTGDPATLHSGEANQSLRSIVGRRNVLLLDGGEHLRRRKLLLPPFHGERMQAYRDLMVEAARRELATWPRGVPFALLPRMQAITFDVILRALFGAEAGSERLRGSLRALLAWTTDPRRLLLFSAMGPERIERVPTFQRMLAPVHEEVLALVRRRRADPGEDVLSMLVAVLEEDGDVRDELLTLLIAGHETTAATLAFAFDLVLRRPGEAERIGDREPGRADAAVRETLRLRPVVPAVVRRLKAPLRIGGHELVAGETVAPSSLLVHRRPDVYPDPLAFRPERWARQTPGTYTWFPFGGGVRRCLGAAFASLEAAVVLEEVLCARRLTVVAERAAAVGRRGIVLVPADGTRVVAT